MKNKIKVEVSKPTPLSTTKQEKPASGISKSHDVDPNPTQDMLEAQDYTKGANDPVGQDARLSRQKAVEFQKTIKQ